MFTSWILQKLYTVEGLCCGQTYKQANKRIFLATPLTTHTTLAHYCFQIRTRVFSALSRVYTRATCCPATCCLYLGNMYPFVSSNRRATNWKQFCWLQQATCFADALQIDFLRASAMLKHVIDIVWTSVCLSVCLSVRHTLAPYQNRWT